MALLSGSHSGQASRDRENLCEGVRDRRADGARHALGNTRSTSSGLWLAVPGGPHDLPLDRWRALAERAAGTAGGPAPVLVTFAKDAEALRSALESAPVHWVQLHGYPTPGFVRKVKGLGSDVRVIKVLHVKGGECVEASLIGAYEKAGVDVFLFDVVTEDGRVGSTGQALDPAVVAPLVDKLTRPFLLAGGISADNRPDYAELAAHPVVPGNRRRHQRPRRGREGRRRPSGGDHPRVAGA